MSNSDLPPCAHWNPFRMLVVLALWLIALAAMAFLAGGCGNPPSANRNPAPVISDPSPASGAISLSWSIIDTNQRLIFCEQANARSVAFRLRNRATGAMVFTAVPCANSPATVTVPAASYDVVTELHDPDGTALATAPPQVPITVAVNRTTPLLPVVFLPNTFGTLVLRIDSELVNNCSLINTNTIVVRHDGARTDCAPTVFIIRAGFSASQEVGQYTAYDCANPALTLCIESNRRLSTSLPAGFYVVHVVGKRGALGCFAGAASVTIVAGQTIMTNVFLVAQSIPGCG